MSSCPDPNQPAADQEMGGLLMERRRILSGLGMAGLGCLVASAPSTASAEKVIARMGSRTSGKLHLPDAWLRRNRNAESYHRYIGSLRLKNIDPAQVIDSHVKERNGVWNTLPPREMWRRMGYVLKVVDRLAKEMNCDDVEIVSAYRSPAYNARCHGAKKGSWHKANVALDVNFADTRASRVTSTARQMRKLGLFTGGVGGYRNFTHIDARGHNADW